MICKIGRYYYKDLGMDEYGNPKINIDNFSDNEIFTLVDFDGEPIKFLRRITNPTSNGK